MLDMKDYKTVMSVEWDTTKPRSEQTAQVRLGCDIVETYRELCSIANKSGVPVKTMFNGSVLWAYPRGYAVDTYELGVTPSKLNKDQDPIVVVFTAPYHHDLVSALFRDAISKRFIEDINSYGSNNNPNLYGYIDHRHNELALAIEQLNLDLSELDNDRSLVDGIHFREWESVGYPVKWPSQVFPRHWFKYKYTLFNKTTLKSIHKSIAQPQED